MAPARHRALERPTVLVCADAGLMQGIATQVSRYRPWELLLCQINEVGFVTANRTSLGLVGAIVQEMDAITARQLLPRLPVVLIDQPPQSDLPGVAADGIAIGELAFRSLRERGFRRFGYWGVPSYWASDQRQLGFASAVARSGLTMHPGTRPPLGTFSEVMSAAMDWLRAAPKPIAICTDHSKRALEMLWASRLARLQVPDQVAILSGEEDALRCTFSRPEISAVDVDLGEIGRRAADLLEERLGTRKGPPRHLLVAPRQVISRQSTATLAEVPAAVSMAMTYIHDHPRSSISVADVVRAAGVPRRTLELAFRTALDGSIHQAIALARVGSVRLLLETTRLSLTEIGQRTGFTDPSQLSRLFARHIGLRPRTYRQRYGLPGRHPHP